MAMTAFSAALKEVQGTVRAPWKKKFLRDLHGQIEEDGFVQAIVNEPKRSPRRLAVTFDRKRNDTGFSYEQFDLLLTVLDQAHGGGGIRKPCNQVRTLIWRDTRARLRRVLRHFAQYHRPLRFRRLMILPCPDPVIGWNMDPAVHMQLADV